MSRPKGSKNKKSIAAANDIAAQLTAKESAKLELETAQAAIIEKIKAAQLELRENKKAVTAVSREIAKLETKKAEADAIAAAEAQKKEIEQVVSQLISGGTSAAEILEALKK